MLQSEVVDEYKTMIFVTGAAVTGASNGVCSLQTEALFVLIFGMTDNYTFLLLYISNSIKINNINPCYKLNS